jgi:alpha-ketoglutarate-dependent taurine dioxygenase
MADRAVESSMCWRRYTIDLALNGDGIEVSDALLASLDAFEEVLSASTRTVDFLMREGELLFADNRRTIHARTPIAGGDTSSRLMIRSWIRTHLNGDSNANRSNS